MHDKRQPELAGRAHVLVLPYEPGALLPVESERRRSPDGLDQLIDDVLGDDTDETAGWFDLALLGVGAGLLVWGTVADGPRLAVGGGLLVLGLGCILPIRSLWRAAARRRAHHARQQVLTRGVPLFLGDPAVAALIDAYNHVLDALPESADERPEPLHAGHRVVMECASLLQGRAVASDAERRYVADRTEALRNLASVLEAQHHQTVLDGPHPTAVVEARDQLDELTGTGSLQQLDQLIADLKARGDVAP